MLEIKIDTDNSAFEGDNLIPELVRALKISITSLEVNYNYLNLYDSNGNKVGFLKLTR